MEEGLVPVKDGKLFYRLTGKGEPLVLVHSLGLSGEAWRHVMAPLSQKFSVYAPDLMGHGASDKPDKNFSIPDYAASMIQLMDALNIRQARVMGNSIGASISLEMSAGYPQRVSKQVLVGCPAYVDAWGRVEPLLFFGGRFRPDGLPRAMTLEELAGNYVHTSPELLEWVNHQRARAGLWCKKAHVAIALYDIVPRLALVKCPTLVMFGSKDMLRANEAVLLKGVKGAKLWVIEGAAHLPQIDAPDAFTKAVLEFL